MIDRIVITLLIVIPIAICYAGMLEQSLERKQRNGAQPVPSARQVRAWKRERLPIVTKNRRRHV